VTPVLGVDTSKSVLILKAGLVVQHCLLVAVLHVCLRSSSWGIWGAARTAVLRSKPHKTQQRNSRVLKA
jgi:hypothetical protein